MKRLMTVLVMAGLVVAGCSKSYDLRLNDTLGRLKYLQRLDQNLIPPPQGQFKDLSIFVRPPKPLAESQQLAGLPSVAEGQFDLAKGFLGQPSAGGGTQAKQAADPNAVLRLYVLARVKAPAKKGKNDQAPAPAPAADGAVRGPFETDVRNILASDLGAPDAASAQMKTAAAKKNSYKRMVLTSQTNDAVRAYFLKQDPYELALIWVIPPSLQKTTEAAINLCMESLAVGNKAKASFQNGYQDESAPGGGVGAAPAPGSGQVF